MNRTTTHRHHDPVQHAIDEFVSERQTEHPRPLKILP